MPVITMVSAKGSPGVTTAAVALTAAATLDGAALLVELDPSGGDVQIMAGAVDEPGVVRAAGELRRDVSSAAIGRHVSVAPPEVPVLLAPTAGLMAASVIGSVLDRWDPALGQHGGTVVVDAGRWEAGQPTARRAAMGDLVVVVCRPAVASVEHTRHTIDRLREVARRPVVALVVGTRPYAPAEVAAQLEVPLGGALAWDPRGTAALWSKGVTRSWGRTWLASSAAHAVESLGEEVRSRTPAASAVTPERPARPSGTTRGAGARAGGGQERRRVSVWPPGNRRASEPGPNAAGGAAGRGPETSATRGGAPEPAPTLPPRRAAGGLRVPAGPSGAASAARSGAASPAGSGPAAEPGPGAGDGSAPRIGPPAPQADETGTGRQEPAAVPPQASEGDPRVPPPPPPPLASGVERAAPVTDRPPVPPPPEPGAPSPSVPSSTSGGPPASPPSPEPASPARPPLAPDRSTGAVGAVARGPTDGAGVPADTPDAVLGPPAPPTPGAGQRAEPSVARASVGRAVPGARRTPAAADPAAAWPDGQAPPPPAPTVPGSSGPGGGTGDARTVGSVPGARPGDRPAHLARRPMTIDGRPRDTDHWPAHLAGSPTTPWPDDTRSGTGTSTDADADRDPPAAPDPASDVAGEANGGTAVPWPSGAAPSRSGPQRWGRPR